MELLIAGAAGFVIGNVVSRAVYIRFLNGAAFQNVIRGELSTAFKHGMLAAADFVTMEGEERLAGMVRESAEIIASNCHEFKV